MRLLPPSADAPDETRSLAISEGETNCILGFIHDGSIAAEPWHRLMGAWGYCERHAWASLAVEMSALEGFVSRSAFLYFDLLRQAVAILARQTSRNQRAAAKRLAERNPCMLCEINPRSAAGCRIPSWRRQRIRLACEGLPNLWHHFGKAIVVRNVSVPNHEADYVAVTSRQRLGRNNPSVSMTTTATC
jgi:hypothetical protein